KEYRERQSAVEGLDAEVLRLIGHISQKKNTLTSLDTKLDLIQKRRERVLLEKRELEENIARSEESGVSSRELLTKIKEQLECIKKEKEDLSGELRVKGEELKIAEEGLSEIKTRLESRASLLSSFEELQANYEGYEDGVRSVMKSKESGNLNGVHGVLVDFIEASPELETAVEAVLSNRLQGIVVDDHSEGMKAVEYLKSQTAGRAQFIPLTLRNISKSGYTPNGSSGVIGKAAELLKCTEKYKNILDSLLGDVLIVKDMESALNIWRNNGIHYTIVTLDGEVIDPYGSITGGKRSSGEQGLMQRKRQMAEIRTEIENLKIELALYVGKRDGKRKEIESLESRIKEKEDFLRDEEIRLINEDNGFNKIKEEIERLKKKMDTLEFEHKEFEADYGGCK
ncbi:MAG: hypothetical protein HY279_07720, partial [Nitrospinae bacterium]|nr:hypothetical protein [Nitrospinota bacterium]